MLIDVDFLRLRYFSPDDTPWEGGTFKLTLESTDEYPNKAPKVKFVSVMFHPNSTYRADSKPTIYKISLESA